MSHLIGNGLTEEQIERNRAAQPRIRRGTIQGICGSWGSGLATLVLTAPDGNAVGVACDNGATVRALDAAFGDVIGPGHSIKSQGGHIGQDIWYWLDDMGLCLAGFLPVGEETPELLDYLAGQEGR